MAARSSDDTEIHGKRGKVVWPQRYAASRGGMVATQHYRATEAGVHMLEGGGNAIDAAVAAAFALGVCEPAASGLGGQTMMLIYLAEPGRTFALDGSSRAPNRALPGGPPREDRLLGYTAPTVPSTPAALAYAVKQYGKRKLPDVLAPAIALAEEGYEITELQHSLTRRYLKALRSGPAGELFLRDGEKPYAVGSVFRQPELAGTLRRISRHGIEDFYQGRIASQIHRDMVQNGGLIRKDDLAQIPWPIERRPVVCRFAGMRVMTFPPPGAGRTLAEMLTILSQFPPRRWHFDTPRGALRLIEIIRRANIDRRDRPFDPNYYPQVQDRKMLSEEYARLVARQVKQRIKSRGETTHLSVMDAEGNVVALTQSIERVFGSCMLHSKLGFLYNNYMSAFEYEDISHPYYLRPNAVPWASVAPTIIFRRRRPWVAIGSPGSDRIASSILQVLVRLQAQNPLDAVSAPRLHCSIRGEVAIESSRMRDDIPEALRRYGFLVDERDPFSFYLGCVQLVQREKTLFKGAADPRRDGSAGGPRG